MKTYKLKNLASVQTGPFGSQLHQKDYVINGTPILTVEHLGENRILHNDLPCISEQDRERLKKYSLLEGDIVFSRVGSVDRRAYVRKEEEGWLFSGRCLRIRPDCELVDGKYLSYYFGLEAFKKYIRGIAVGATMPSLNTNILNEIVLQIPPLETQSRIASILSSLDDKIELNLQMNKTLEAIAQAIFKEWFVDFRFPGFDGELVDGLPKGWRNGHLIDILDLRYGKALKSEERKEGKYPVVGSGGVVGTNNSYFVTGPGIVIGRKGTIGKVYWIEQNFYPIDTTFFIKDTIGVPSLYFHYFIVRDQDFQRISSDSAVPGLNKNEALKNRVVVPDVQFVNLFNDLIKPLFDKIKINSDNITTLTSLRDSLLPKLINGKIRVS